MTMTISEAIRRYGNPDANRDNAPDPAWEKAHIVYCGGSGKAEKPALPGVPARLWVGVHRLVEPALRAGLTAAVAACPDYEIERLGCYVFRHQRHDPTRPLSIHSVGSAVDINPDDNSARNVKVPIEPWSPEWRRIWPDGLPRPFVEAMEAHGWEWGGRWPGFVDPMHFQVR